MLWKHPQRVEYLGNFTKNIKITKHSRWIKEMKAVNRFVEKFQL